ncbi:MAG TPA: FkbM family methyltransferase [Thermoanaerobaculia bacterium]|nr:FkbM family methyltransferase [Thermoanaerobaculia bacterium]
MRPWLNFALAQVPGIYTRLLGRRRRLNCEKLAFLAIVRRGDVVFDVGANDGYYTLLFSHLVGRRGQVHAFEPVPPTFGLLEANVGRERRFDNVVLNNCALAAADGSLPLHVPQPDHGQASIVRQSAGSWAASQEIRTYTCQARTVDGYLRAHGEEPPAFVKCDVEGAELHVLAGAIETLRKRPPLLHLEVNANWTRSLDYEPPDLVRFLVGFGYSRFLLVDDHIQVLDDPRRELSALQGSANLICAVPEAHRARLRRLLAAVHRSSSARRPAPESGLGTSP